MMMPKCHDPCGKKVRTKTCVDLLNSLVVMASWAFYPGLASALPRRVKSDPGPKKFFAGTNCDFGLLWWLSWLRSNLKHYFR